VTGMDYPRFHRNFDTLFASDELDYP